MKFPFATAAVIAGVPGVTSTETGEYPFDLTDRKRKILPGGEKFQDFADDLAVCLSRSGAARTN